MDKQITLFDGTSLSKETMAIKLIQEFEDVSLARNPLGYIVGYYRCLYKVRSYDSLNWHWELVRYV